VKSFTIPSKAWAGFRGYKADPNNAGPEYLSQPSLNCLINENGIAETRMGIEDTGWDLNQANKPSKAIYIPTYDVTFFALGTKLKYVDHNAANAVVDTGLTLTTGTVTRFAYNRGDLYLSNTTDGLKRIVLGRLNDASATSGDATVTIDVDMAARLTVFGNTSGDLRISGTNEAFSSLVVSTGVVTLSGTLSASYTDNKFCIFVHDISSTHEKASKIVFWKERMHLMGFPSATDVDQPNNTVVTGQFVVGQTGATTIEKIIDFTYGTGGSTKIPLGDGGSQTNMLKAKDYIYFFKETESYVAGVADVTTSGAAIGETIPQLRDENFGCQNEDCAASMGNGEIAYLTRDRRIMRIKISTVTGAAVVYPDESFDLDMRYILRLMDDDQTGSLVFYHKGKRRLHVQVKVQGQWLTLIYDNNLSGGAWQPPITGWYFSDYFERKGVLYACDGTDDTVYRLYSTLNDNGAFIECYIASAIFDIDDASLKTFNVKGSITQQTTINLKTPVNAATTPIKTIAGKDYSYGTGAALNSFILGGTVLNGGGNVADTARYRKNFDSFPVDGNSVQMITWCFGDSQHYSVKSFLLTLESANTPFTPLS
jgi:hypothetical protein